MNTIYSYSTETYQTFRGWRKIGQTRQESAEIRVQQQDGTSNPEPLILEKSWSVPDWVSDRTVRAELKKMKCKEVRMDKLREWVECTIEHVDCAINSIVHGISRPNNFLLRDEQKVCRDRAVNHFGNGGKRFLMNAKMRFGKTFTTYKIIQDLGYKRVLVITYKPTVDSQWREDLDTHVDFDGWTYHSARDFTSSNPIKLSDSKVDILFTSFQDFNDFEKEKWDIAKNYEYDLVVIDEMHYGSNTERAQRSLAQLNYNDRTLFISGTPLKALMGGQFLDEEIYTWGYADEQACRKKEELNQWATEVYRWLPVMNFHIFEVSEEAKKIVNLYSKDEGFSLTKMMASNDGEKFIDASANKLFWDQFFGIGVRKEHSPMRTCAVNHIVVFVPPSVNSATALSKFLEKYENNDHKVLNVSGDNIRDIDYVKEMISRYPKTITISCGRFNTGTTVPEWDMVVMLDDGRSPETYFQSVFRCQNPDKARGKESCTVIDFNPQRCLEMIYEFADITANQNQSTQQSVKNFIDYAPVLDHTGNRIVNVDFNRILNVMAETGGYAERFGSNIMLNWSVVNTVADKFFGINPDKNIQNTIEISDNGLEKGKNLDLSPGLAKNPTVDEIKAERELRQRVITVMRRIPTYLFLEKNIVEDIESIIKLNNESLFYETVGIHLKDFAELCNEFIKTDRLNRAIISYNQIESI
jgi:hypothetical protein